MKNEKFCFKKSTGFIVFLGILLIGVVMFNQSINQQTSTNSRATSPTLPPVLSMLTFDGLVAKIVPTSSSLIMDAKEKARTAMETAKSTLEKSITTLDALGGQNKRDAEEIKYTSLQTAQNANIVVRDALSNSIEIYTNRLSAATSDSLSRAPASASSIETVDEYNIRWKREQERQKELLSEVQNLLYRLREQISEISPFDDGSSLVSNKRKEWLQQLDAGQIKTSEDAQKYSDILAKIMSEKGVIFSNSFVSGTAVSLPLLPIVYVPTQGYFYQYVESKNSTLASVTKSFTSKLEEVRQNSEYLSLLKSTRSTAQVLVDLNLRLKNQNTIIAKVDGELQKAKKSRGAINDIYLKILEMKNLRVASNVPVPHAIKTVSISTDKSLEMSVNGVIANTNTAFADFSAKLIALNGALEGTSTVNTIQSTLPYQYEGHIISAGDNYMVNTDNCLLKKNLKGTYEVTGYIGIPATLQYKTASSGVCAVSKSFTFSYQGHPLPWNGYDIDTNYCLTLNGSKTGYIGDTVTLRFDTAQKPSPCAK